MSIMTNFQTACMVAVAVIKPMMILVCVLFGWWLRGRAEKKARNGQ